MLGYYSLQFYEDYRKYHLKMIMANIEYIRLQY